MQSLATIRNWQIDQLRKSIPVIGSIIRSKSPEAMRTYRDGGDGWTTLEIMCHLRDFENVYLQRARLTLEQDNPDLPFPDPNQLVIDNRYNEQDIEAVYREWVEAREAYVTLLEGVDDEQGERPANHPTRGPFTLHDQLFLTVWHDTNHIEQMTRTLDEKKQ